MHECLRLLLPLCRCAMKTYYFRPSTATALPWARCSIDTLRLFLESASERSGRTWIVQIAYRRAFDRRAYLFRRKFYDGTELGYIQNTLQVEARYEEQIADLLTGEQLHAAFEELSEKQRATLEMYFFEGLDLREISGRLGETLESIRHFYYRGLDRLRKVEA